MKREIKINDRLLIGFFIIVFLFVFLYIQPINAAEIVSTSDTTVCCEKTVSGLSCQDVSEEQCAPGARAVPTACESTSFCRQGTCVDSSEGTCTENTPQLTCNNEDGVWFEESPAQCSLGCCVLGDQAAFVTLTRCKALSSDLGLETNYRSDIVNEQQCVLSVAGQEKGACVYDFEFQRSCKLTTRADCASGFSPGRTGENGNEGVRQPGEFFAGKLCSAEELNTVCGLTTETTLVAGKDEVYWKDSCGNPANIYDANKVDDKEYWSNIKTKSESCNPNDKNGNANSKSCGNCNYLLGSFGRLAGSENAGNPRYGDYICADLNCQDTSNGNDYRHGESWCVNSDEGDVDSAENSVGSRFYKHLCINGEEVVETCSDFRQATCVEDKIVTELGDFSQAACVVNRWQDCFVQDNEVDCTNTDRRDCLWKEGDFDISTLNKTQNDGVCVPSNTPGFKFWEGQQALNICASANAQCVVTFEEGLFGGEECTENCECLSESWERQHAELCSALGDCGPGINWVGQEGFKEGYEVTKKNG